MIDLEKKTAKEKIIEWYEKLDPTKRKQLTLFGGSGALFIVAAILISATSDNTSNNFLQKPRKVEYTLFNGKSPRDVSIDAMAGKIKKLTEDFSEIRALFQRQDQKIQEASKSLKMQTDELNRKTERLAQQTGDLMQQMSAAQENLKNQIPLPDVPLDDQGNENGKGRGKKGGKELPQPDLLGQQGPPASNGDVSSAETGPKIRVVTGAGEEAQKNAKSGSSSDAGAAKKQGEKRITEYVNIKKPSSKTGIPDMFLPAGSILSGTLVTGLDAPTSNQSRNDPFPSLLRVKHEAILPNRYRMDIRECFLIASGYGDLSAERAYMRAERISCVKKDGAIIETAIDAYSVGEDGKAGVRGRLVSKNGQIISNSLLSGFVSGITNAFAPQKVRAYANVTPGQEQVFQYPSPEMIGGQALMGGIKGAAEQIADYYLEMAKNIFPIIEVDAGRKIDFIMIRGMSLSPKSKSNQQGSGTGGSTRSASSSYVGGNETYGNEMMGNMMSGMLSSGGQGVGGYLGSRMGSGYGGYRR